MSANKSVKYNGQLQVWFNSDGSIGRKHDSNSVFAEWTAQGYRAEVSHDDLSNEWLKHFDLNRGIVEYA